MFASIVKTWIRITIFQREKYWCRCNCSDLCKLGSELARYQSKEAKTWNYNSMYLKACLFAIKNVDHKDVRILLEYKTANNSVCKKVIKKSHMCLTEFIGNHRQWLQKKVSIENQINTLRLIIMHTLRMFCPNCLILRVQQYPN